MSSNYSDTSSHEIVLIGLSRLSYPLRWFDSVLDGWELFIASFYVMLRHILCRHLTIVKVGGIKYAVT
jgi:hypothetical protein